MKEPKKDISDIVAAVLDYGSFEDLADRLGETFSKVYYHTPTAAEFVELAGAFKGVGLDEIVRLDDYQYQNIVDEVDLWIVPDIGYAGWQNLMREQGKLVWGSMDATNLELYRTRFIDTLKRVGLPMVKSVKVVGLTKLAAHLRRTENKWVKTNRFRGDIETFHHIDYEHTLPILNELAYKWGPLAEIPVFVVQDPIDTEIEIGYDGMCVDGKFPAQSFQGYELKNELYLGSLLPYDKLPESVRTVNAAMAPVLAEFGYRNFMATEIREKDGVPYFIDPTFRMAGQTMEHQLENCTNIADVILRGAAGEVVTPEFQAPFAAEATMHYTVDTNWKTLRVPEEVEPWVKLYHYCYYDGMYCFPPHKSNEVGVITGIGDTPGEAIEHLKSNFEKLSDEPLKIEIGGFVKLIGQIETAEKAGVMFSEDSELPEPAEVIAD